MIFLYIYIYIIWISVPYLNVLNLGIVIMVRANDYFNKRT